MRKVRRTSLGHCQFVNHTSLPTALYKKWITKSCQLWSQPLEIPADWTKKSLGKFIFHNRVGSWGTSGHAKLFCREVVCSISTEFQTSTSEKPMRIDHLREIAYVICHEIGHMAVAHKERYLSGVCDAFLYPPREGTIAWKKFPRSRRNGQGWGGDEEYITRIGWKLTDIFAPKTSVMDDYLLFTKKAECQNSNPS